MINSLTKNLSSRNFLCTRWYKNKPLLFNNNINYLFSKQYKIISDPKEVSKLIFDNQGKCKIFEHKNGEFELKWIVRVISSLTVLNSVLTGL